MLTFATRFVLKVVVGKTPMGFDLKAECPRECKRMFLQNSRVLQSKVRRLCGDVGDGGIRQSTQHSGLKEQSPEHLHLKAQICGACCRRGLLAKVWDTFA